MIKPYTIWLQTTLFAFSFLALQGCYDTDLPEDPPRQVGLRTGTVDDDYLTNGERGTISITEINWAGSIEGELPNEIHHPDDIFIELRNSYTRPVHLTGWFLYIERESSEVETIDVQLENYTPHVYEVFALPTRENLSSVAPNEYVTVARFRDGAFPNADYYIEDLHIPGGRFEVTLRDLDGRLISDAGDTNEDIFAGGYDGVSVRSMERVQLLFSNQGGRNSSWHSYAFNTWDEEHATRNLQIAETYRALTYASPGLPNSPDYSGNTSAGGFE